MKKLIACLCLSWFGQYAAAEDLLMTGVIRPLNDVELSFSVDGIIDELFIAEGDSASKGQALLKLEDTLQSLDVERRRLAKDDDSELQASYLNLQELKQLYDRKQQLKSISRSVSDTELNRLQIQLNTGKAEHERAEAAEKREAIELSIAENVLSLYTLKAPFDGQLVEVVPRVGEWVKLGTPVLRFVDVTTCYLELDVELEVAVKLSKQQQVPLTVHQAPKPFSHSGIVEFISPVVDAASGLVRVKITMDNQDQRIKPGVTAALNL